MLESVKRAFETVKDFTERHPGLSIRAIAAELGLSYATVQRTLKAIKEGQELPATEEAPAENPKDADDFQNKELEDWLFSDDYTYNADADTYITFLKSAPKPLVVPGSKHRAMLEAYSNFDDYAQSINEVCRRFAIPRDWFVEYKRIHGWTHDHEPITAERMMDEEVDENVKVALQKRRALYAQRFEKEKWRETQRDADRYRRMNELVLEPLQELVRRDTPPRTVPRLELSPAQEPYMALVNVCDVHFGKYGNRAQVGADYNRRTARQGLLDRFQDLLTMIARHGQPDKLVIALNGDLAHIDNKHKTTTRGTPQDTDGNALEIVLGALDLPRELIELARQMCGAVEVEVSYGNHDEMFSGVLMKYLHDLYQHTPGVKVNWNLRKTIVRRYGVTVYFIEHGDNVKPEKYGKNINVHARQLLAGTLLTEVFTGDKHHLREQDYNDFTLRQGMSVSGPDLWHSDNHYRARQGMNAYLISRDEGVKCTFTSPVLPDLEEV